VKEYKIKRIDDFSIEDTALFEKLPTHELVDVTSGKPVEKKALVGFGWSKEALYICFDAYDDHIWGNYEKDDDPIWKEEAVEAFLSFGEQVPKEYFELQFSPKGVKYDAWVKNPTGDRNDKDFDVNVAWNFKSLEYKQIVNGKGDPTAGSWKTLIKILSGEIKGLDFEKGDKLRGNFFRIDGYPEQNSFQALVPNFKLPPNFHTPENFAIFTLE